MCHEGALSSLDRPLRTCVGCRRRHQQRRLTRFVVSDGSIVVDTGTVLPGRGAYVCWRRECAHRVLGDGRRLVRALRAGSDSVTVNTGALLQDWEANQRRVRARSGTTTKQEGNERCAANTVHLALGDNT